MCTSTLLFPLTLKLFPEPGKLGIERRFKRFGGWAWDKNKFESNLC
jgi:hypothetical protein